MSTRGTWLSDRVALGLVFVWAVAVASGFGILLRYKHTPSQTDGGPPGRWPSRSRLEPARDRPTLVMFAHPHCACTHASVSELARLVSRVSGRLAVRVALVRPAGVDAGWDDTELARRAGLVEGAQVSRDDDAVEAARFGAAASGFTVVYDASGRLRFAGGITSARGHEGDSFGLRRILTVLEGGTPDRPDAPVFGCSLGAAARGPEAQDSSQEGI